MREDSTTQGTADTSVIWHIGSPGHATGKHPFLRAALVPSMGCDLCSNGILSDELLLHNLQSTHCLLLPHPTRGRMIEAFLNQRLCYVSNIRAARLLESPVVKTIRKCHQKLSWSCQIQPM